MGALPNGFLDCRRGWMAGTPECSLLALVVDPANCLLGCLFGLSVLASDSWSLFALYSMGIYQALQISFAFDLAGIVGGNCSNLHAATSSKNLSMVQNTAIYKTN